MEPRFRGGVVILARSFARIHETNLKKQGLVPLTFTDPATYDEIGEDDRISVLGLPPVPGQPVRCQIVKPDGGTVDFETTHTFSDEQVEWFKAGSALNIVRPRVSGRGVVGTCNRAPPSGEESCQAVIWGRIVSDADTDLPRCGSVGAGAAAGLGGRVAVVARRVGQRQLLGGRRPALARLGRELLDDRLHDPLGVGLQRLALETGDRRPDANSHRRRDR